MIQFFRIFLIVFGFFESKALDDTDLRSLYGKYSDKFNYRFRIELIVYLNHPETIEKINTTLTEEQKKFLTECSEAFQQCLISYIKNKQDIVSCEQRLLKNYDMARYDDILSNNLRAFDSKAAAFSRKFHILNSKLSKILRTDQDAGLKFLEEFTEEENMFIRDMTEKYNRLYFHTSDFLENVKEVAALQKDTVVFYEVCDKMKHYVHI